MIYRYSYSDELYHHGILGQKWGQRNYQNPDGSLTALGRVRYGVGNARDKVVTSANKAGASIKAAYKVHKRNTNLKRARQAKEKKAEEAKKLEADREKYSKSRESMYKHQNLYTKDELNAAKSRFEALEGLKPKTTKLESYRQKIETASKWLKTGTELYKQINEISKLMNPEKKEDTFAQKRSKAYLKSIENLTLDELTEKADDIKTKKEVLGNLVAIDAYARNTGSGNSGKKK